MLNGFYWMVEQMVCRLFEGVVGYVENEQATRCQQEMKDGGSYLFNYESYYNGLMTDWG